MPRRTPVNVLVATSVSQAALDRIASFDRRVRVADGAAVMIAEVPEALRPGQTPAPNRSPGKTLDELLEPAEVVLAARHIPLDLAARAPRLRWVQIPLAGTDWFRDTDLWARPEIAITTASGVNTTQVAEWVLLAMLALAKQVPRLMASKRRHQWDRLNLGPLRGKTVAIVGYGAIGREVARLSRAFGMEVVATKRLVRAEERLPPWVLPHERLHEVLTRGDFVVLAVPATAETMGLIGERELAVMRPTAYLINIARGDVLDEGALIAALRQGRLAGAGLDVFRAEPLLQDSPLWELPNVFMSSHVAGLFDGYDDRVTDLFLDNLRRYLAGRPLRNVVDRQAGY